MQLHGQYCFFRASLKDICLAAGSCWGFRVLYLLDCIINLRARSVSEKPLYEETLSVFYQIHPKTHDRELGLIAPRSR